MTSSLPGYYRKSKFFNDLHSVVEKLIEKVNGFITEKELNLFVLTTTDLSDVENDLGLDSSTVSDIEIRRARVLARIQGYEPFRLQELHKVLVGYGVTDFEIVERPKEFVIDIYYNQIGAPENFDLIEKDVRELKLAHVQVNHIFQKNTWETLSQRLSTWSNAKGLTWGELVYYNE